MPADTLTLRIEIQDDGTAVIRDVKGEIRDLADETKKSSSKSQGAWGRLDQKVKEFSSSAGVQLGMGGVLGGIIAFTTTSVTKLAEFNDKMIDVQKTTEMADEEIKALGDALREMAVNDLKGMVAAETLAEISEQAGQMGTRGVENLEAFTEGVAMMGEATDLTAQEAAEGLGDLKASFREQLEASGKSFESFATNIGSSMNALSAKNNAFVSDIMEVTRRISGASKTIGLSIDQAAALAATIKDSGIDIEVGGTAMTKFMLKLAEDSDSFAEQFGLNAKELAKALKTDPMEAITMVLQGMDSLADSKGPGELSKALNKTIGSDTRLKDALLKLSGATEKLDENLQTSATAFEENVSLQNEFANKAESNISKWKGIGEKSNEVFRSFGDELKPATDLLTDWASGGLDVVIGAAKAWQGGMEQEFGVKQEFFDVLVEQGEGVVAVIAKCGEKAGTAFGAVEEGIEQAQRGYEKFQTFVANTADDVVAFYEDVKALPSDLAAEFEAGMERIKGTVTQTFEDAKGAVSRFGEAMNASVFQNEQAIGFFQKLTDKIYGVETALEKKSLTPALRRYIQAALESGTATGQLSDEMRQSMEAILVAEQGYQETEQAIRENQNAVREYDNEIRTLQSQLRSLSNEQKNERAALQEAIVAKQNEKAAVQNTINTLKNEQSTRKEQISLLKEEIDGHKANQAERVRIAEEQAKLAEEEQQRIQERIDQESKMFEVLSEKQKQHLFAQENLVEALEGAGIATSEYTEEAIEQAKAQYEAEQATKAQEKALKDLAEQSSATAASLDDLVAGFDSLAGNLGTLSGGFGKLGDLFGIKELGGLGSVLGQMQEYAQLPALFQDIGGAASGLLGSLGGLGGTLSGISGAFGGLGSTISGLLPTLGPLGLAGGAIALAWKPLKGIFKGIFGDAKSEGNKAAAAMREFVDANIEGGAELSAAMREMYGDMKAAGFDYATFIQEQNIGALVQESFGGFSASWQEGTTAMDLFAQAVGQATGNMEKAPQVSLQMVAAMQEMGLSAEDAGAKMLAIAEASGASEAQVSALTAALGGLQGGAGAAAGSISGLSGAEGQAAAAAQQLHAAAMSASGAMHEISGAAAMGQGSLSAMGGAALEAGTSGIESADGLTESFERAGTKTTYLSLATETLKEKIEELPEEKMITLRYNIIGEPPGMAAGGTVPAAGLALVGDKYGPEIARFPSGRSVFVGLEGPEILPFPAGTEIIPNRKIREYVRTHRVPAMAEGGIVPSMPLGSIIVQIDTLNVQGQLGNASDMQRMADELGSNIAKRINEKVRRKTL